MGEWVPSKPGQGYDLPGGYYVVISSSGGWLMGHWDFDDDQWHQTLYGAKMAARDHRRRKRDGKG